MPLYEYKCPNGHLFEVIHKMQEPGPEKCEICGAAPVVIVLHPVAVHYKGSGFYTTDYGGKSKAAAAAKESGGSSSDSGSSDSGSSSSGDSKSGESKSGESKKAAEG
jgi:putative FmdB family regulatory protein